MQMTANVLGPEETWATMDHKFRVTAKVSWYTREGGGELKHAAYEDTPDKAMESALTWIDATMRMFSKIPDKVEIGL